MWSVLFQQPEQKKEKEKNRANIILQNTQGCQAYKRKILINTANQKNRESHYSKNYLLRI